MNSDCSRVKACVNHYCVDPCEGTCGTSAKCDVVNHIPMCSCLPGTSGDPFTLCRPHIIEGKSFLHFFISTNTFNNDINRILIHQSQGYNRAHRLLAVQTASAEWWTIMQFVLARVVSSVLLLPVDQNASWVPSVHWHKLVLVINVKILVQALVVKILSVKWSITIRYAAVQKDTLAIHFPDATWCPVSFLYSFKLLVYITHLSLTFSFCHTFSLFTFYLLHDSVGRKSR